MLRLISLLIIVILLTSCADSKVINGVTYQPYGWIDSEEVKSDKVVYKVSVGSVIWSCILVETLVAPVLITGYNLYEPIGLKPEYQVK